MKVKVYRRDSDYCETVLEDTIDNVQSIRRVGAHFHIKKYDSSTEILVYIDERFLKVESYLEEFPF